MDIRVAAWIAINPDKFEKMVMATMDYKSINWTQLWDDLGAGKTRAGALLYDELAATILREASRRKGELDAKLD